MNLLRASFLSVLLLLSACEAVGPMLAGVGIAGATLAASRNISGGAEGPAAGTVFLGEADGTNSYIWTDATGDLRINNSAPTGSSGSPTTTDLAGVEVGAQTSWHELKQNIVKFTNYQAALDAVVETTLYSFDMEGLHYDTGYVIHEEDRGSWFSYNDDISQQQIPSLKMREIVGTQSAAIKALNEKILRLEKIVEKLSKN